MIDQIHCKFEKIFTLKYQLALQAKSYYTL